MTTINIFWLPIKMHVCKEIIFYTSKGLFLEGIAHKIQGTRGRFTQKPEIWPHLMAVHVC